MVISVGERVTFICLAHIRAVGQECSSTREDSFHVHGDISGSISLGYHLGGVCVNKPSRPDVMDLSLGQTARSQQEGKFDETPANGR